MAPDVKAAIPLAPYAIRVVFADGAVRDVDIEPLLGGEVFAPLRDRSEFERVTVDEELGRSPGRTVPISIPTCSTGWSSRRAVRRS